MTAAGWLRLQAAAARAVTGATRVCICCGQHGKSSQVLCDRVACGVGGWIVFLACPVDASPSHCRLACIRAPQQTCFFAHAERVLAAACVPCVLVCVSRWTASTGHVQVKCVLWCVC